MIYHINIEFQINLKFLIFIGYLIYNMLETTRKFYLIKINILFKYISFQDIIH